MTVHYPRDGITYMRGQCGANSVSSTTDLAQVTCGKCLELINNAPEGKTMELTRQEELFLDRIAMQMIQSGSMDIEAAGLEVLKRDRELVGEITDICPVQRLDGFEFASGNAMGFRDQMAKDVYVKLRR